ncbi:MAG: glycosyltransferase family 2 protein [Marinobacter adhaerens]
MSDEVKVEVSFIIPTFNESENIQATINSIRNAVSNVSHEIIVVDNGSTDDTVSLAEALADKVLINKDANIGELRNIGVRNSTGEIFVFNDADVLLTGEWSEEFSELRPYLKEGGRLVIGGSLDPGDANHALLKGWFMPVLFKKAQSEVSYVGTGHMLVSSRFFRECGGFDPNLVTGEDSDFCLRAKKLGAQIKYNGRLRAVHLGYPLTARAFFKREAWHGRGDFESLSAFLNSKVAMYSTLMLISHIFLVFLLLLGLPNQALIMLLISLCFPVIFSFAKFPFKIGAKYRVINVFFSYSYLLARSFSWVPQIAPRRIT